MLPALKSSVTQENATLPERYKKCGEHVLLATLGTLVSSGGSCQYVELGPVSGYSHGMLDRAFSRLIHYGCVQKPYVGMYMITERGRIAYALMGGKSMRRAAAFAAWAKSSDALGTRTHSG